MILCSLGILNSEVSYFQRSLWGFSTAKSMYLYLKCKNVKYLKRDYSISNTNDIQLWKQDYKK